MARARRQHDDIAGLEFKYFADMSAELDSRMAAGDAERFVNHRMIMHERIDAVAPLSVAPVIVRKQFLDGAGRAARALDIDRTFVDENRQCRIVRHSAVVLE